MFNLASMEPALSSPAKKRRRTILEVAAEGSLDIRASLQRGSAALPPAPSLSLPQTCALLASDRTAGSSGLAHRSLAAARVL